MKRKQVMAALLCSFCMAVSAGAPMAVSAEETEAVTEVTTEAAEEAEVQAPRPDYNALEYVTLGEYKGLAVELPSMEATEEQIEYQMNYYISLAGVAETVTEGTVENGDTANIDYEGKLDGVAFDGGTAKSYDLEIGSGSFIDGFEEGLIGVEIGATVDLPLTFPENYHSADLAGKEVIFTVTVNEVSRIPELSDDLVNKATEGEYTDIASYKEHIAEEIKAGNEANREYMIQAELLTQIANNSQITGYPQELMDYEAANVKVYYEDMAEAYAMEFPDFLSSFFGLTEEDFNAEVELLCQQNLQQELYLKAIAETEGIVVDDAAYEECLANYMTIYGEGYATEEEFVAAYGEDLIRVSVMQELVLDFLTENAVVTEAAPETEAVSEAAEAETEA